MKRKGKHDIGIDRERYLTDIAVCAKFLTQNEYSQKNKQRKTRFTRLKKKNEQLNKREREVEAQRKKRLIRDKNGKNDEYQTDR